MPDNEITIIRREKWGAITPTKPYFIIFPEKIIVHGYSYRSKFGKSKSFKKFKGIQSLKKIQSRHIKQLGLIDIKYHFIIAPDGSIYEGRPLGTAGCHCDSHNNQSIGIMIFGNFNVEKPTREQIHSFLLLLKFIKKKYPHLNIPSCLFNHSDLKLTLCPGHHLANMIRIIKSRTGVRYDD